MKIAATFMLIALVWLAGCATREQSGALAGGAAGGLLGSALGHGPAAVLLGAAAGAAVGGLIGNRMDRQDQTKTAQVLEGNRTNQSSTWVNPDTKTRYTVTPTRTYQSAQGPCRKFKMDADLQDKGQSQRTSGTACRQPDGSWKITS